MTHKIIASCIAIFLLSLGMTFSFVHAADSASDKIIQESDSTSTFESYVSQNELGMLEVTLLTK